MQTLLRRGCRPVDFVVFAVDVNDAAFERAFGALRTGMTELQVRDIMVPRAQMNVIKAECSLEEILAQVIRSKHSRYPHSVFGLGDGGAHCGVLCDASIPTYMLTYMCRDRTRGETLPLEYMVHKMTRDTALLYGIEDRGLIAPGYRADLNLIDYDALGLEDPKMVYDLPAGGRRFVQKARGYVATICAGEVTYENGEHTGAKPGRLLRGAVSG